MELPTKLETKEELMQTLKEWVKKDNEIRQLQKQQTMLKNEKKQISVSLLDVMKRNEIECFDINDGKILYNKKNVKKPISQKKMIELLSRYYDGDLLKATEINNFLLDNREEVVKETIVRKITSP
jgi:hypothetical protein